MRSRILIWLSFLVEVLLLISVVLAQSETDLSVAVVSDAAVVPIHTNFTYRITVQNSGTADATFVSVTDNLPPEVAFLTSDDCTVSGSTVSCDIGVIAANESVVVTYQARAMAAGTVSNAVSVSGAETDPDPANNTAAAAVEIIIPKPVDLTLSGSVSSSEANLGDRVDLSFVVSNNDSAPAYLTQMELVLPSQLEFVASDDCSHSGAVVRCSAGIVAVAASVNLSLSVRAAAAGNPVSVTALVTHIESDPDSSNNGAALSLLVHEPPAESADLQLGATASTSQFTVDEAVDFTFTAINAGPATATEVRIISDLPDGLVFVSSSSCVMAGELLVCDIGELVLNAVYIGTVRVQSTVVSAALTLSASVVGNQEEPNLVNNVASVTLASVDPAAPTITATVALTATPIIVTTTPGPSQTPVQVIATQPVYPTKTVNTGSTGPGSSGSGSGGSTTTGAGGGTTTGDILPDGVAPSDIYGWTRYESIAMIQVTGRWSLRTMYNASDGAYHESRDAGAILRFPFEGDGIRIGYRSEVHGGAFQVLLDGELLAVYGTDVMEIDPELTPPRQTFVTQPYWVPSGYHVVDVRCLSDGQGTQGCNIDYIETFVGPPVPAALTGEVPSQALVVEHVELIAAPPTLAPTGTPAADSIIVVDVFVTVDLNANAQIEPDEGVSGLSVQAIDVSNNTPRAASVTDDSGFVRMSVATTGDVVLLIPLLGESFYVRNRGEDLTETWTLVLDAATVPGLIP